MKPEKRPICLEIAHDIVVQIFDDLRRERKHEAAEQARVAMKALIDLSNLLEEKEEGYD